MRGPPGLPPEGLFLSTALATPAKACLFQRNSCAPRRSRYVFPSSSTARRRCRIVDRRVRGDGLEQSAAAEAHLTGEVAASSRLDEWARRAAQGDHVAFEAIYDETAADVLNYLSGMTRGAAVAEDLAANVFLKAWRSARSYRAGSNTYRRWLFAIARNEVANHWRSLRSDVPLAELDFADTSATSMSADDAHERITQAMGTLTPEQRDVIVLRYFMDKSYEEMAHILGKREGAVRALVMRALRRMRKVVEDAAPA